MLLVLVWATLGLGFLSGFLFAWTWRHRKEIRANFDEHETDLSNVFRRLNHIEKKIGSSEL